jgi:MFS family permease
MSGKSTTSGDKSVDVVHPVTASFIFIYTLAYFGVWMALLTPPTVTLALRVTALDAQHKAQHLSLILTAGAIVAMFANPIAGYLSDRTTLRMGMRRPWLVGGMCIGLVGLYCIAVGNLPLLVAGWCLTQLGLNAVLAAIVAILPDQVPVAQRGRVSGLMGICLQLGIVAGVLVAKLAGKSVLWMFMAPGAIAAGLVLILALTLDDRRNPGNQSQTRNLIGFLRGFLISPHAARDFLWAFASRFLLYMGLSTLLTYQVFYLIDKLKFSPDAIPQALLTSTIITTITSVLPSIITGWLSDFFLRRKVFVFAASVLYALGLLVIGLANAFPMFLVGIAICGVGQGVYFAVDLALVSEVLPNSKTDAAKDLGLFNLANVLPQSLAPSLAPLFLAIGSGAKDNYTALFLAAALFAALGAAAISPIRGVR